MQKCVTLSTTEAEYVALLRGIIFNKTYGIHKNLPGIYLTIFTNNLLVLWSPVIADTIKETTFLRYVWSFIFPGFGERCITVFEDNEGAKYLAHMLFLFCS